jgi:hypothetical protein
MLVRPFCFSCVPVPRCFLACLKALKSVLKHRQAAQKTERESEMAMCDRMQMYKPSSKGCACLLRTRIAHFPVLKSVSNISIRVQCCQVSNIPIHLQSSKHNCEVVVEMLMSEYK